MWTTADKVRRKLGLNEDEASDVVVNEYIVQAQDDMLHDLAIFVRDEGMSGNIDGVNTTFTTKHVFWCDRNFDLSVNTLDLELYKWGEAGSIDLRETITASTFYPNYGVVVLNSAPASTYDVVSCTYYYVSKEIDVNRIPEVCSWLAAYYYALGEFALMPEQWMHGAYRFTASRPWIPLHDEYVRRLESLLGKVHDKGESGDPGLVRGGL